MIYFQTGFVVDRVKKRNFVMQLFLVSGLLTLCCYIWLALPPSWTETPMPGIASFAIGNGFSPCELVILSQGLCIDVPTEHAVLLVVMVPRIVPSKYVSTTLGAHKAVSLLV